MADDLSILFDRIRTLLNHDGNGSPSRTDEVEHTLTDGYARALALEGERRRTEDRIRELAGHDEHVAEQRRLKLVLQGTEDEVVRLRELLRVLAAEL
jgi:hypothetical protein